MNIPELYKKYHIDKDYTSIGLFKELNKQFNISKAFYPGSYVHITPSLVFSNVTYADSYKNTNKFFESASTMEYVNENKEYTEETTIRFFQQDYNKPFKNLTEEFDLAISQYAGFIGQASKPYLKTNGLLVCNNSHGDASMASIDSGYELIAVYRRKTDGQFSISNRNLMTYLIPKNGKKPIKKQLIKNMKGVAYTRTPSGYIFRKVI